MISQLLVKKFVKDYSYTQDEEVRDSYGYLGGIIGICANSLLFGVKLSVGIVTSSIAVTADAFNNLSDAASSIITILGFKLASKPADKEHPFGHGRIEYLSGLIVSFLVLLVGIEFIKTSFSRIISPKVVKFQLVPFLLILVSIGIKLWLSKFNKYIGKAINSSALTASSFDAFSDVITSSCVALSLFLSLWIKFPIDGYIGIIVSLFVLYSGYNLIKDTLNPLLGEAPDPELVNKIIYEVTNYEPISGVHDLIIHNYGPGKIMASIHAEVPCDISILKIHEVIDMAEKEISQKYKILLVIHMDPINTNSEEISAVKKEVLNTIEKYPVIKSIHDFRIIGEGKHKNVLFDAVIDYENKLTKDDEMILKKNIENDIKTIHCYNNVIITIDRDFTSI